MRLDSPAGGLSRPRPLGNSNNIITVWGKFRMMGMREVWGGEVDANRRNDGKD